MRGGIGDVVRAGVCLLLAAVLLGAAWPLWRVAERLRADDADFPKVAVVEDGRPTDQLKVCGDRYRKPYCIQRERVTVRETDYDIKRAATVYTLELTRADKRAMELRYRDHRTHEERDSVYGRARAGEPGDSVLVARLGADDPGR